MPATNQPVLDISPAALPATTAADPMIQMIERVLLDPAVDIVKLERLEQMYERAQNRQAEQAFNAAFARMQPRIPTIAEKGKTDKSTYAPREDIVDVVRPILSEHGFSLSFRTEWPDAGKVLIVGILTHDQGHSRGSSFLTAGDQSGSKNAIQALGSAVEYGRRYTTTDLLNIVTRRADDDGQKSGQAGRPDPPEKFQQWWDDMTATADTGLDALEQAWTASPKELKTYVDTHMKREKQALKRKAEALRG